VLGLPVELEAVDRLLNDRRFFEPCRVFFHARFSRLSGADRDLSALCRQETSPAAASRGRDTLVRHGGLW